MKQSIIKGTNGELIITEEYLEISRKSLGGFLSQGSKGNRRFFYVDISSIEYKKPKFTSNGYIQIIASGTNATNNKNTLFGSSSKTLKDPNTITLRSFSNSEGERVNKLYEYIMNKIKEAKQPKSTIVQQSSKMDELKKLADLYEQGILSQEEFQTEKKKLLEKE
jgi:hypothetical protein